MSRHVAALLIFFLGLSPLSRATVLLDDTWADGTRNNSNLPTDSAWYASSASSLSAATHAMTGTTSTSSRSWWTYFTTNAASPVQLSPGDTLKLTLVFTPSAPNANNTSFGLRIGLFDFSHGTRTTADGSSPGGSNVAGYMLNMNFGQTFSFNGSLAIQERTTPTDSDLMGTAADYTTLTLGGGSSGSPGFSNGVPYSLVFSVTRNAASVTITTLFTNATGWSVSNTATDTSSFTSQFDGFDFRPANTAQTATSFVFSEFKVEFLPGPGTAPTISASPTNQTVFVGQTATFDVSASGSAPLTYQWYFNTNTLVLSSPNSPLLLANVQTSNAGPYLVIVTNANGSATSSVATLTVNLPVAPTITTQPTNLAVSLGQNASFSVVATGTPPLFYQWYVHTNTLLSNATNTVLLLTNVQPGDAGQYSVIVSNAADSVTSSDATLFVNTAPTAPSFTTQPLSLIVRLGGNAVFSALAIGTGPIAYQWNKGATPLPGATSTTLSLTNVQLSDAATYSLTASNSLGVTNSAPAALTVSTSVPPPFSAFNLVGFGQATTGGGLLPDTDPNYAQVFTATDLALAINSKTVKVIEIMNDLDLGYNEIPADAKAASEPFRADNTPLLHPVLVVSGVSIIDIQKKNGLTIFSATGATLRHGHFNVKNSANIIIRNLKFDELWEWDEATKGQYDQNNWDFITVGDAGAVTNLWLDHCTFTKSYDGLVDIKNGSANITLSWCKYTGDDGATNTNSWVRQQIFALEAGRATNSMYNFLRNNGFSLEDIVAIMQGHDKTHLIGANDLDPNNALHTVTLHHEWFINPWDRLPRLRGGNVHDFNIYVDDTLGLAARRLRDAREAAMTPSASNTLNNTYSFKPFLNGTISTENGATLVEKSVYIDCLTPLRNNQTDPSNPTYTGKILARDTIYQMDDTNGVPTVVRGDSTDPGNPLGLFQAPVIAFSWNLPGNQLPYTYTPDDPSQLKDIVTDPAAGAGAGVLTWPKTNWLLTVYPPTAPFLVGQLAPQNVPPGQGASFSVVAGGSAPLAYQWYFNTNTPIPGATNAILLLLSVQITNAGLYSVTVTNSVGLTNSAFIPLTLAETFGLWQTQQFTSDQLTNPAVSAPGAAPAGDAVPNLVKYALGLPPLTPVTRPLFAFRFDNTGGVLSYHRPPAISDVAYRVQVSANLSNWTENGVTQQTVGTDPDGLQIWEARYTGLPTPTRFFQLLLQY